MFVLCTVFGCLMIEARWSEWKKWDRKLGMILTKRISKNWSGNFKVSTRSLRQWITDVYEETKHSGYVLGSLHMRESVSKIGKRLGHEKQWPLHELTRTLSTYLSDSGVEIHVEEQLLRHALPDVAGVYNRSKFMAQKLNTLDLGTSSPNYFS